MHKSVCSGCANIEISTIVKKGKPFANNFSGNKFVRGRNWIVGRFYFAKGEHAVISKTNLVYKSCETNEGKFPRGVGVPFRNFRVEIVSFRMRRHRDFLDWYEKGTRLRTISRERNSFEDERGKP